MGGHNSWKIDQHGISFRFMRFMRFMHIEAGTHTHTLPKITKSTPLLIDFSGIVRMKSYDSFFITKK